MEARRRGERRRSQSSLGWAVMRYTPTPSTTADSFSSDCGAPQPPVWLTLVEITWQNQFNVITQPRASSCLRERRSLRYWSRASPSHPPQFISHKWKWIMHFPVSLWHINAENTFGWFYYLRRQYEADTCWDDTVSNYKLATKFSEHKAEVIIFQVLGCTIHYTV